jgi:hypothetical protein
MTMVAFGDREVGQRLHFRESRRYAAVWVVMTPVDRVEDLFQRLGASRDESLTWEPSSESCFPATRSSRTFTEQCQLATRGCSTPSQSPLRLSCPKRPVTNGN